MLALDAFGFCAHHSGFFMRIFRGQLHAEHGFDHFAQTPWGCLMNVSPTCTGILIDSLSSASCMQGDWHAQICATAVSITSPQRLLQI